MAAQPAMPSPKEETSPAQRDIHKIQEKLEHLKTKMQNKATYCPERAELEQYATQIISVINQFHPLIKDHERFLKAAVIDLTEVPVMHAQMQRIAIETALKDAIRNLEDFSSPR